MACLLLIMTHGAPIELPTCRRPDYVAPRTIPESAPSKIEVSSGFQA